MDQKEFDQLKDLIENHTVKRMDRIEGKLDQLTDAVVAIARAEEKIAGIIKDIKDVEHRVSDHEERIDELEVSTTRNTNDLESFNKFFWIIVTAVTMVSVTAIGIGIGFI